MKRRGRSRRWIAVSAVVAVLALTLVLGGTQATASNGTPFISSCPLTTTAEASDTLFVVWACASAPDVATAAGNALAAVESHYKDVTGMMGAPIPDNGTAAAGGDSRTDIYLLPPGSTDYVSREGEDQPLGTANGAAVPVEITADSTGSGYIMLREAAAKASGPKFIGTATHELFHLTEFQTNIGVCDGSVWWFTEASAEWAVWRFVPQDRPDVDGWFTGFQQDPLMSLTDSGVDPVTTDSHSYESWIWPLFMYQRTGNDAAIANVWANAISTDGLQKTCDQLNQLVDSQVAFSTNFRDFAVRNFDTKFVDPNTGQLAWPVDFGKTYQQIPDGNFPVNTPALNTAIAPAANTKDTYTVTMNPLSADYVPLTPQAPTTALAFDLRKLGPDVNADLIIQEQSTSGSSYDKPYLRIKLTHARFALCGMADGMGPVQGYLILSNHSMTATVNGSMTVQTQSACAKTATEQYSSNSTLGPVVGPSFVETAAVTANGMSWKASPTAFGMKYKSGTGTVTVSDADQNYEGDCSGQGSFNAKAIESDADLDAWGYYQNGIVYGSYSAPPLDVAYPWRSSWTFPVTCPDETLSVPAWGGATGCPKPAGGISWNTGTWVDDHHTRFSFNCTGTGSAGTNEPLAVTITGYATATGVIPCGAWTTREQGVNCPVDGAYPYSAS